MLAFAVGFVAIQLQVATVALVRVSEVQYDDGAAGPYTTVSLTDTLQAR